MGFSSGKHPKDGLNSTQLPFEPPSSTGIAIALPLLKNLPLAPPRLGARTAGPALPVHTPSCLMKPGGHQARPTLLRAPEPGRRETQEW